MEKHLFMNGVGICGIRQKENEIEYLIEDDEWEVYKKVSKKEFVDYLKKISWSCLTSYSEEHRQEYIEFVKYVSEVMKKEFASSH